MNGIRHLIFLMLLWGLSTAAAGEIPDPLIIAVDTDYPPFSMRSAQGRPAGIFVDIWRVWARKTGRRVRFLPGTWTETLANLKNGSAHIHSGLFYSDARSAWIGFSRPFYETGSGFFHLARRGDQRFPDDFPGAYVGVISDTWHLEYFERQYPDMRLRPFPNNRAMIRALLQGTIDVFIDEPASTVPWLNRMGLSGEIVGGTPFLFRQKFHAGVLKGRNALTEIIDRGLAQISEKGMGEIEKRWIPDPAMRHVPDLHDSIILSAEEKAWLRQQHVVRVRYGHWPPFMFCDGGPPRGIAIDYVNTVFKRLGIRHTYIGCEQYSWPETLEHLKQGQDVDMVPTIVHSPERERFIRFTQNYLSLPFVIFTRDTGMFVSKLRELNGRTVAVEQDYMIHDRLSREYPEIRVTEVKDSEAALRAVSTGQADAYVGNLVVGSYLIAQKGLTNLKVAAPAPFRNQNQAMGVRKDWPDLAVLIDKTLYHMTPREHNRIRQRWLALRYEHGITPGDVWKWGIIIVSLLGAVLAVILIWNRRLKFEIRERETAERKLQNATLAAETANRAKSIFLANMSHELRTPLNAILGFSQLLAQGTNFTPDQRKNLGIIARSGEHLLALINQILDVSRIEAGRMTLDERRFDLHGLLEDLVAMFWLRAGEQSLRFDFERAPDLPRYICSDQIKLRQVLTNLLDNAIKFTPAGGVWLRVGRDNVPAAPQETFWFEVRDTGVGILPEEKDGLFNAFVQMKSGLESQKGAGLGLAICRSFVTLMGGRIGAISPAPPLPWADQKAGPGTLFRFTIRAGADNGEGENECPPTVSPPVGRPAPDYRHYRILVADDKWDNRQLLIQMLRPVAGEIREAPDGRTCADIWRSWRPHLIWMDLKMPVMNGYEAVRRIRAEDRETENGERPVIIAVTAGTSEAETEAALAGGCDECLHKPFRAEAIFTLMRQYLGSGTQCREDRPAPVPAETETPKRDLSSRDFDGLSPELVVQLRDMLVIADISRLSAIIDRIRETDAGLARTLKDLVDNFEYDKILAVIP
ncbi:hypothetical protein DENIS_2898 [Desulfonema ishimotonii]|uniref:histidine kinase n=1 Tax=Desulfonema ishimotonii TaxID=45657 RepID=A0A401FYC0_9BACT|nr:transporter substrate-binding domain-containing protein [Desulfonema ishimotonii]GBC61936.1 hypothetical protein DENIS_2898 [Desulfonema ishimotonii]